MKNPGKHDEEDPTELTTISEVDEEERDNYKQKYKDAQKVVNNTSKLNK